jgi:hypothetical protein
MRRGLGFIAFLTVLEAARANAYVRSTTDDGMHAFYWKESCVPVTIYLNGFDGSLDSSRASGMSPNQIIKSVTAAAHTWSTDAVSCPSGGVTTNPSLEIVPTVAQATAAPPPAAWDGRNSVIFRTDSWSRSGKPPTVPADDFPFEALAVTTVTARLDGHIVDVDMEVNGVNKNWMNLDPGVSVPFDHGDTKEVFDLQNALTHEFGHFIGLDHTCFIPSDANPNVSAQGKIRPQDDQGNPVPDCDSAPESIVNTVMFNSAPTGQTSKRVLSPDDIRAVCEIYPASRDSEVCALDSASPGCAVAPERSGRRAGRGQALGLALGVGALGMLVAVAARRRG